MIKKLFACFILCILCACQVPDLTPFSVVDFQGQKAISMPASTIQVQDKTVRYPDLPHLETRIPVVPAYALQLALQNRFAPTSTAENNTVTITIDQASLVQKEDPSDHWYILNNMEYRLDYQVTVTYMHQGHILESQTISGWEVQALPRKSALAEKEAAWQKMINAMIYKVTDKIQADMPPTLF